MRYVTQWMRSRSNNYYDPERPLSEHLGELRTRLLYSTLAIVVCAILGFVYAREIIGFLMGPLKQAIVGLDVPPQLHFTSITEPLFQSFRIAIFAGIGLAFPYWVYQLWLFVSPGLYNHEKKMVGPVIVSATALFIAGAAFAYTVAVPIAYRFLLLYANPHQAMEGAPKISPKGPRFFVKEVGPRGSVPPKRQTPAKAVKRTPPTRSKPSKGNVPQRTVPKRTKPILRNAAPMRVRPRGRPKVSVMIQEPDPKKPSSKFKLQMEVDPSIQKDTTQRISTPEQWLGILLRQKNIALTWKKGQRIRQFELHMQWPDRSEAKDTMGELKPILTLQAYLSLSSWFLLGFGLIFQTPLVIFLVTVAGIITPEELGLYRRHAFVAILAVAAVLTPTGDPLNLMIMAIPMYILFEIGLLVSRIYLRNTPSWEDEYDDEDE